MFDGVSSRLEESPKTESIISYQTESTGEKEMARGGYLFLVAL